MAAPSTMSPPAKTPGIEVWLFASTWMWPCLSTAISGVVVAISGFDSLPMATMTLSTSSVNSLPGIATGRRRPLASGSPSS